MAHASKKEPSRQERNSVDRRRYWVRMLGECERSGVSQVAFARERGISVQTLRWWKSRLSREATNGSAHRPLRNTKKRTSVNGAAFVPVSLVASAQIADPLLIEVVLTRDRVVRIHGDFDPEVLRKVLSVIEPETC
jgi:hypothetical protein